MSGDARLEELLDKQACHEVITRYCRALDWLDEESLASVFWPDAEIDYGFFQGSGEKFIPFVMEIERRSERRWHLCTNALVQVDGTRAQAECYGIAQATALENGEPYDSVFGGRYLDELEKRDGEWRISRRRYVLDWMQRSEHALTPARLKRLRLPTLEIREPGHPQYRRL